MNNTKIPASFLFCLALFALLAVTGSAQESKSTQTRLYVDPFFTEEVSGHSTVGSTAEVQPYETKRSIETSTSNPRSNAEPNPYKADAGGSDHGQRSFENRAERPTIDETVVPSAPLRQRSCRPY